MLIFDTEMISCCHLKMTALSYSCTVMYISILVRMTGSDLNHLDCEEERCWQGDHDEQHGAQGEDDGAQPRPFITS